jgi:hypothetical protein
MGIRWTALGPGILGHCPIRIEEIVPLALKAGGLAFLLGTVSQLFAPSPCPLEAGSAGNDAA